jgi:ELWxxDGT repeat protein
MTHRTLPLLLVTLSLLAAGGAVAEPVPALVKDINRVAVPANSSPRFFASLGGVTLLLVETGQPAPSLLELWRSDGTEGGTFRLLDNCGAGCLLAPQLLATGGGRAFFTLPLDSGREELWVSNGTAAGTVRLGDPLTFGTGDRPAVWVGARGLLFFAAIDDSHGRELWRSDGTASGTFLVTDLAAGAASSDPRDLTELNGKVYFGASDAHAGGALWRSDGTASGTVLVKDPVPGSVFNQPPGLLRAVGGKLLFQAPTPKQDLQLWRSDGTAKGTAPFTTFPLGAGSFRDYGSVTAGSRLFFMAPTQHDGVELWVSDGTARGTRVLTHMAPESPFPPGAAVYFLPAADGRSVYFFADDGAHGTEPWVSDGTPAGTRLIKDVCPGPCEAGFSIGRLLGNRFYFAASDGVHGNEPWSTDGTEAGTRLLSDLCPGSCDSDPHLSVVVGPRLGFSTFLNDARQAWATDGTTAGTVLIAAPAAGRDFALLLFDAPVTGNVALGLGDDAEHGVELWRSNLTLRGTRLVRDINTLDLGGSHPSRLKTSGGTAYFFADDGLSGYELWKSDGTAPGTVQVIDADPGPEPAQLPEADQVLGVDGRGFVYFFALTDPSLGYSLWRSDGTAAGSIRLTGPGFELCETSFAVLNDRAYFALDDDAHGCELWSSDGTAAGTQVLDVLPGRPGLDPVALLAVGGRLYFRGRTVNEGEELWTSDGTVHGTALVKDVSPGSDTGIFSPPVALAGRLYFLASDGESNTDLWVSDGTAAGTRLAVSLSTGSGALFSPYLVSAGGRLWISGVLDSGAPALLGSDGTPGGTVQLAAAAMPASSTPVSFQGRVYFAAGGGGAQQLWVSDGTAAGTHPLRDHNGAIVATPGFFSPLGERLLFLAGGSERPDRGLWQTDGTAAGTVRFGGVVLNNRQDEDGLAGSTARLFFTAYDPGSGTELWSIAASAAP